MKPARSLWKEPGVRNYLFVAGASLLITFFVLTARGGQIGAFLAVLVAVPGLIGRWPVSPILYLVVVGFFVVDPNAMLVIAPEYYLRPRGIAFGSISQWNNAFSILDLALVMTVMVYLMAQYRLFSLMHRSIPSERIPFHRTPAEGIGCRLRPARLVRDDEFPFAFALLAGFVLAGQLIWLILWELSGSDSQRSSLTGGVGVFLLAVWSISVGMLIAASLSGYLHMRHASRAEAETFLRDGMWQETYREQQRLHRWRVWYRQRQSRG